MKIAFFFSYKNSIESWKKAGILERELEIFDILNKKYGFHYTFVTYGTQNDSKIVDRSYIDIVPLKTSKKEIKLLNSLLFPFKLKNTLRNVDLIQQNQLPGVWVSIITSFLIKKPLFIRTGYDYLLFSKNQNKNKLKVFVIKQITKYSLKFSSLYTVTSNEDYKFLTKNFQFNNQKLKIRQNWVISTKNPYQKEFLQSKILCVGRLAEQKNYEYLLNSFKNIRKISIDIVGTGEKLEVLQKLSRENNISVNFLGKMENSELKKLYSKYEIFISTSTYEGNPKNILEAMGAGCIVIASDIPNHKEIIEDKINGILFNLEKDNLSEIYFNIAKNEELKASIKQNSLEYITKNNNIELIAELINQDLNELTNSDYK